MKKLFAALALVVATAGCIPENPVPAYAEVRQTVHPVYVYDTEGKDVVGNGSGVMIAPFLMVTAAHVVMETVDKPLMPHRIAVGVDRRAAKVLRVDRWKDVALLQVAMGCPCAQLASVEVLDLPVLAVGYPAHNIQTAQVVTEGRIAGVTMGEVEQRIHGENGTFIIKHITRRLVSTAPIAPGNSGGGLFTKVNGEWKLIGINVAVPNIGDYQPILVLHLALVVPSATVLDFIHGQKNPT